MKTSSFFSNALPKQPLPIQRQGGLLFKGSKTAAEEQRINLFNALHQPEGYLYKQAQHTLNTFMNEQGITPAVLPQKLLAVKQGKPFSFLLESHPFTLPVPYKKKPQDFTALFLKHDNDLTEFSGAKGKMRRFYQQLLWEMEQTFAKDKPKLFPISFRTVQGPKTLNERLTTPESPIRTWAITRLPTPDARKRVENALEFGYPDTIHNENFMF
jgi:hypothetical protein